MVSRHGRAAESGSVIIYIFICIALFAALSYTVAAMMRGGEGRNTDLKRLGGMELIQYADAVRNAVRSMQIDGARESTLCFDSPGWGGAAYNYAACGDAANRVFDESGGGVIWEKPSAGLNDGSPWLFSGANGVEDVGTTCAGASCADLTMILPGITREICVAINNDLGIAGANDDPPEDTGFDSTPYVGAFAATGTGNIGDEAGSAALAGHTSGCFKAAGKYNYYRVILAR